MTSEALPHWDLSNVYPGLESAEFTLAVDRLTAGLDALDGYLAAHGIDRGGSLPSGGAAALAPVLDGYLERMNALLLLGNTLDSYADAFFSTDSYNTVARRKLSELEALTIRRQQLEVRFRGWVGTVAEQADLFRAALEAPDSVRAHAF